MAEKLMAGKTERQSERGFVLATALVMLSLMTLLSVAMFFTGRSSTQISSSAQHSTEGHYYAETAVNYMIWAMRNDAEFDSFKYSPYFNYPTGVLFVEPAEPGNAATVGDWSELLADFWDPGPTEISDSTAAGTSGQVMYFDNTPLAEREIRRALVWPLPTSGGKPVYPTLYNISSRLPRYIVLDIDSSGKITPAIPALPHAASPVAGTDIPLNGAIIWLTGGDTTMDIEYGAAVICAADTTPFPAACDVNSKKYLASAGIVVYAIGYVQGRPSSIIRAQIK